MFSSASFAEWTKVSRGKNGDTLYVDMDSIKIHRGYFYYWRIVDYLKPNSSGDMSHKTYSTLDCKLFRQKGLSVIFYDESMGKGVSGSPITPPNRWHNIPSNTSIEKLSKSLCDR